MDDFEYLNAMVLNNQDFRTIATNFLEKIRQEFIHYSSTFESDEASAQKTRCLKDIFQVYKIDNHIHASAAITQQELIRFIRNSLREDPNKIVKINNNSPITLKKLTAFKAINQSKINTILLDTHVKRSVFGNFKAFESSFYPFGYKELKDVFLRPDNYINGEFFGRILRVKLNFKLFFLKIFNL
jgi:AMP deaminase